MQCLQAFFTRTRYVVSWVGLLLLTATTTATSAEIPPNPCPPSSLSTGVAKEPIPPAGEFEGRYRVGPTEAQVQPVRMAFEIRWERGEGSMPFFYEGVSSDGYSVFVSAPRESGSDRFYFTDTAYREGAFLRADGTCFPVKKLQ